MCATARDSVTGEIACGAPSASIEPHAGRAAPDAQAWFRKTMEGSSDQAAGTPFTPLECFVMEPFRSISPNGGSISTLKETR
jgi:hypothetical protein